jgi:hydroxypyruvate reductase
MYDAQDHSLHDHALAIFDQAVQAADPARALRKHIATHPFPDPKPGGRTLVIAVGKAAPAMLREALTHIQGDHIALGVTHYENTDAVAGTRILRAAHPVPDENGLLAAREVTALLQSATAQDQVIALISGGGSALLPAPVPAIGVSDKAETNALLLSSGLDIVQMNLVRQQLSQLKGGGFLRCAAPAPVTGYILSDVIGNDLRAVASGPTAAPIGTHADARRTCIEAGIWPRLPNAVRNWLDQSRPSEPDYTSGYNILIGSNRHSLDAALKTAAHHFDARIVSDHLTGAVHQAAATVVASALAAQGSKPQALLFGGETTVQVTGSGRGGRNQELALRVATMMARTDMNKDWVFLSGGTDGRDGPTEAAGGLVDPQTLDRITQAGIDPATALAENDSFTALEAAQDLLITQATGTNVADIQCLLIRPRT